ncbi:amidohydrolase family protein [Phytohabitans rumicis]|uniref:Amidohydrolase-related domain-containing protein n=1 Tax=Phytohabitans rumicis TaxID=1076125 RepID=A0A6V8LPM3_9ACTN|nr:hypothetical protein [Phytohabitans rumicis]GFJ94645.1 hypothetical protein Prum_082870 [Phytohabitans rumicis]
MDGRVVEVGDGPPPVDRDRREYAFLAPALVDGHCHVTGYRAYPNADTPFAPHRAFLALLREAGVGAVRDLGNHAEMAANLPLLPDAPIVRAAGPVLDEPPGRVEHCRLVVDEAGVRDAVRRAAAEGLTWVKTYSALRPRWVAAAVEEAAAHGLRVAHRPGRTDAVTAVRLGVASVEHLPLCLSPAVPAATAVGRRSPADIVRAWADPAQAHFVPDLMSTVAGTATAVTPLLLAWRRAAVLEEAVAEPLLDRLEAVAPYHKHLHQMRGPGLAFGRKYARRYLGYEQLRGQARQEFEQGWAALCRCLVDLAAVGVPLVAGSDAPGVSLVPGYALHAELAIWEAAGLDRAAVLAAATTGNARWLGIPPWSAGVLALPADPFTAPALTAALAGAALAVAPATATLEVVP